MDISGSVTADAAGGAADAAAGGVEKAAHHQHHQHDADREADDARERAADAQPGPVQHREQPDHADGDGARRSRGGRPQRAQKDRRGERGIGDRRRLVEPIDPAHDEARSLAEGAARIHIEPAGLGQHGGELRDRHGAEQCIQSAHDPEQHDEARIAERRGQRPRQPQDAGADGAAEHHGHAEAKT